MIRCQVVISGYRMSALRALARKVYSPRQVLVKLHAPLSYLFQASSYKLRPTTHTVIYLRALYPCRSLNPKPFASCSCNPKPMFYFPGKNLRARSVFSSAAICIIFSGLDASTPPPPPPPYVPLDPLDPLVLAAVIELFFPGWRSCIPALANRFVFSR